MSNSRPIETEPVSDELDELDDEIDENYFEQQSKTFHDQNDQTFGANTPWRESLYKAATLRQARKSDASALLKKPEENKEEGKVQEKEKRTRFSVNSI